MVGAVLSVVLKEVRGLHQAAFVLAAFTIGSQLLALIRDRLFAHTFGAGTELDLYYAAFRLPDLLYVVFASMLSVYVLIPFVTERMERSGEEAARALLSHVFTAFLVGYSALALLLALCAPYIVAYVFPGFVSNAEELVHLMRILLLQPFLLGISSLFGVITQMGHRFVLYAVSPILYNVGIILGIVFLYPFVGISGLAWGVVLGAFLHFAVQVPFVKGSALLPRVTRTVSRADIQMVLASSLPRALTLSLHQIVLVGLTSFASIMAVGSVSVFQLALNLQSVPLAIIGVSYSVAAFPILAQLFANGNRQLFREHIVTAMRHILFWSLPVIALIVVVRAQFVRVILGSGQFDWNDTRLTAAALALFALSLGAQAINLLLVRALYAAGNTRLPFLVTLMSSALACFAALALYFLMHVSPLFLSTIAGLMRLEGIPGTEVLALPLGYSFALIVHILVLLVLSRRELGFTLGDIAPIALRAFVAAGTAGTAAYVTLNVVVKLMTTDTLLTIFLQGFLAVCAGLAAGTLAYALMRTRELTELWLALSRRVRGVLPTGPQDEDRLSV